MRWPDELADPLRYRRQLERMHARYSGKSRLHDLVQDGVRLAELVQDKPAVARMLARAVADGSYRLQPVRVKWIRLDKPRELYSFEALDFVVHSVVGELLAETVEPILSPNLWSYRAGLSNWRAVRKLGAFVRHHLAKVREPKRRGIYVLRADVRQYIDTVPVDPASALWPDLAEVTGLDRRSSEWSLLEEIVRPHVVDEDDAPQMRRIGLPMGSPTATIILNFYLRPLDQALDALGGAFYSRFGDDIAFADEDPARVRRAVEIIDEVLAARRLSLNPKKKQILYWNGAGRASSEWPEARGAREVVFLGCSVGFDGTISLPRYKSREVLAELRARVRQSLPLLDGEPLDARASALVAVVNETLTQSDLGHSHAKLIFNAVTSRAQLGELDRQIARLLAEALTGDAGARALRRVSWRKLRDLGLESLVATRNKG